MPSKNELPGSPTQVLRRFRVVFNAIRSHFQEVEKKVGISGAQVWALSVIRAEPGIGMGGLAKSMDIHQSTASNLVKALVGQELILVAKDTQDKRHVHLQVTPQALTLLKNVPGPFQGVLPAALARLSPPTLQRLDQDLGALIDVIQADEHAGQVPLAQM